MKVLIVGAGVAGLAIGWRLVQEGCAVEILERGITGRGATWASAGMIAPGAELDVTNTALTELAREAKAKWRDFAAEIEQASGHEIGFRESGSLVLAEDTTRANALLWKASELQARGAKASWISPDALRYREPLLSHLLDGALYIADDAQVDNRALAEALRAACLATGVNLRERCDVRSILVEKERACGVITAEGPLRADRVVLACGAWTNLVGGPGTEELPSIKPVKGQMVACEAPEGVALPRCPIWGDEVYLVPRRGRLLVGATVEDAGFDMSVSRAVCERLIGAASRLVPAVKNWHVVEMWAGLRPRSADDLPVLGESAISGLYIASGQFRNGILFAPAVGDALRALIVGRPAGAMTEAFRPSRFIHA